ncbi:glutamate--cysteine ligase [Kitasatospora sp. CMC57]|uniref:Putative glutamate--cysteine ligase 2 n=1 Tax=Kitasatospora sp. CMC57 TaxID=3231513 RepID=A0AB33K136_9ACTN
MTDCTNFRTARPTADPGPLQLGVEEEYLLVDPVTRATVPLGGPVLAETRQVLGERAECEFFATQLEVCTPPVATATELRRELVAMRRAAVDAAARAGCLLVASGTAVLPSRHPLPLTPTSRYRRIAEHVGPLVTDRVGGEASGCHVHLGELTRGQALLLSGLLRPWLPVFQAVSANSPFVEGMDRNWASGRSVHYRAWPTVGPSPLLDETGYERLVRRLISSGVLLDRRMIYWYARPSEHVPTLEVRIADVNADPDVTVLLAVLLRGLARTLLDESSRRPAPTPALSAAHRWAARSGLRDTGLDPFTGDPRPMVRMFEELLDRAAPGLAAHGDLATAHTLAARLISTGTGADRQRAAYARRHVLADVVDDLAAVTALAPGPVPA